MTTDNLVEASTAPGAAPTLGERILDLLLGDPNITDVHCATDEPLRARRASNDWTTPLENGEQIIVTQEQIAALINGIYEGEETPYLYESDDGGHQVMDAQQHPKRRQPHWIPQLNSRKVLHPSKTLRDVRVVDGKEEIVSLRVRFTFQKQDMGDAIGVMARALRALPGSIGELGLPVQVEQLIETATAGLLIVTGPTGSGKSTTIAAILQAINKSRSSNIITLEDPVEFEHTPIKSFFNQREIGVDVESFEAGVLDAMRFAPDILVIGEIRTAETMRAALRAAESGHLVLASTHAGAAVSTIRKMLAYLDSASDAIALSNSLVGVIAQALIPDANARNKKHLAYEVLACNVQEVQTAIADGSGDKLHGLEQKLRQGHFARALSLPFMASLKPLVQEGKILPARAAAVAQDSTDRQELLNLGRGGGQAAHHGGGARDWSGGTMARRARV